MSEKKDKKIYKNNEIIKKLKNRMLYQKSVINYAGKDTDGNLYTEDIAKYLLEKIKEGADLKNLLLIGYHDKRKNFVFKSHSGKIPTNPSNRREDRYSLKAYNEGKEHEFGKIINYQVNIIPDTKVNADLIARKENGEVYIVEVKGFSKSDYKDVKENESTSNETLLRACLEVESYYLMLSEQKETFLKTLKASDGKVHTKQTDTIKKAVWVEESTRAWQEYKDLENRKYLKELIEAFGIDVICSFK